MAYTDLMVAVAEPRPIAADVAAALARLIQLMSLPLGWDGESAAAPDPTALRNAMLFLIEQIPTGPAPSVGPGIDGSVEMEWELPARPMATITFGPGEAAYLAAFTSDEVLTDAMIRDRTSLANGLLRTLAGDGR